MIITIDTNIDKLDDIEILINSIRKIMQPKKYETISIADLPDTGIDILNHLPELTIPDVDSSGLPHDERIHSLPPKINADGNWRKRKNVSGVEFAKVEAELRGIPYTIVEPVTAIVEVPLPPPTIAVIPPPPMPPPPPDTSAFTKLMLYITPLLESSGQGGTLKVSDLEAFALSINCEEKGKGKIAKLQELPHLIPLFLNMVNDHVNKT